MTSKTNSTGRQLLIVFIVAAVLLLGWILLGPGNAYRFYETKAELARMRNENDQLKEQNAALRNEIDKLTSNPEYIEEVAREQRGFLKKNELVFDLDEKNSKK